MGEGATERGLIVAAAILGVISAIAPVRATVLIPADLGELARDAVAIVRGRVAAVDARWDDNHRTIETIVTVEAEAYLKGAFGPTIQFRIPGGELGRLRTVVVGAPAFSTDEHVVVFLGARGPSIPYVLGFNQGVFRVVRGDADPGWVIAPPPLFPAAATTKVVRGAASRRPMALADFEQRVRALAGGSR
jgi:hypothetical protein